MLLCLIFLPFFCQMQFNLLKKKGVFIATNAIAITLTSCHMSDLVSLLQDIPIQADDLEESDLIQQTSQNLNAQIQ